MPVTKQLKINPHAVTRGVIPYLQVEGAAAAVEFYKTAFGAVERSRTPGPDGKLMNAQLEINGGLLMVMDAMPEHGFPHQPSHSFTMQLIVPEGQGWFDRAVAAGCTVQTPFQKMFWGDLWGGVTDPFGIQWGIDQPQVAEPGFEIVQIEGGVAAVEWGRPRFADIPAFQRAARGRVNAAITQRGLTKASPDLTFSRPPEGGAMALGPGVMVAGPFEPVGAVAAQVIPPGRAVHFRLEGPYERLGETWIALNAWKTAQGLTSTGLGWEIYSDPAGPVTDLYSMIE